MPRRGSATPQSTGRRWLGVVTAVILSLLSGGHPMFPGHTPAEAKQAAQAPKNLQPLAIAVFGLSITNFFPHMVAEQLGYFRLEGLDVQLILVGSSAEGNAAVVSGSAALAYSTPEQVLKVRRAGINAKAIMATTTGPLNSIVVRTDIAIERGRIADLKGLTLGVPGLGGGGDLNLRHWLRTAGLDPERDVKIVNVGGGGQGLIAALQAKRVDGILSFQPFTSQIVNQLRIGKVILDPVQGEGAELFRPGNLPWNIVYGKVLYVASHRNEVIAYIRAMNRALQTIRSDPDRATDVAASVYPLFDKSQVLVSAVRDMGRVANSAIPASMMPFLIEWFQILGVVNPGDKFDYGNFVFRELSPYWTSR